MRVEQNKFIEEVCPKFENLDENKLEYTQIHKEYCDKFESKIVGQVKDKFPNFSEKEFAETLVKKIESGEIHDRTVLDTLCSFEDFSSFKELILQFKQGNTDKSSTNMNPNWNEQHIRNLLKEDWTVQFKESYKSCYYHSSKSGVYRMDLELNDVDWAQVKG